jgi:hypothetical protein
MCTSIQIMDTMAILFFKKIKKWVNNLHFYKQYNYTMTPKVLFLLAIYAVCILGEESNEKINGIVCHYISDHANKSIIYNISYKRQRVRDALY